MKHLCEPCLAAAHAALKEPSASSNVDICTTCMDRLQALGLSSPSASEEASFEDQLAGLGEYLKHAALSAITAVAEGHPEQVLDLVGNLLTSYEKMRYFPPLVATIDKIRAENKETRDKARVSWKENYEHWWTIAEHELDFMKRAKDAGLTEEGCFKLLERTFPAEPEEPAEAEESPLSGLLDKISDLAVQIGAQLGGGCGGRNPGGGGGGGDIRKEGVSATPAAVMQAIHLCPTCQKAVDQFVASNNWAMPSLDDLAPRSRGAQMDRAAAQAQANGGVQVAPFQADPDVLARGRVTFFTDPRPPNLSSVASHYGVPGVSDMAAQVLAQNAAPYLHGPSLVERAVAGAQPINSFDLLEELMRRNVIVPTTEEGGYVVEAEMARALWNLNQPIVPPIDLLGPKTIHDMQQVLADNH